MLPKRVLFVLILLYILQISQSRPYKEKEQEKIQAKQAKVNRAVVRLKKIKAKHELFHNSVNRAREENVNLDHSNRSKWIRKDKAQVKIDGNIKRHRLIAKYINIPPISDALNHHADLLHPESDKLQKKKEKLKRRGKKSYYNSIMNFHRENYKDIRYFERLEKYQHIIEKNEKYLSTHNQV